MGGKKKEIFQKNIIKEKKIFQHLETKKMEKQGKKNPKNLHIFKEKKNENKAMKRKQKL